MIAIAIPVVILTVGVQALFMTASYAFLTNYSGKYEKYLNDSHWISLLLLPGTLLTTYILFATLSVNGGIVNVTFAIGFLLLLVEEALYTANGFIRKNIAV